MQYFTKKKIRKITFDIGKQNLLGKNKPVYSGEKNVISTFIRKTKNGPFPYHNHTQIYATPSAAVSLIFTQPYEVINKTSKKHDRRQCNLRPLPYF